VSQPASRNLLPGTATVEFLDSLGARELSPQHRTLFDTSATRCEGTEAWRARKLAEARGLLALCEAAPPGRLFVLALDLASELKVHVHLGVPVPVSLPGRRVEIVRHARMLARLLETGLDEAPAGHEQITLTFPGHDVWHPCVSGSHRQCLALDDRMPAGITLVEMVLRAYEVLSLRSFAAAPWDCRGVLNPDALAWWREHLYRVPLTSRPFFDNDAPSS